MISQDISNLSLTELREVVDSDLADYRLAKASFKQEQAKLLEAEERVVDAEEAQRILQLVAQTTQQQAHDRIAGVVTRCLAAVFEDPYEFKILFEQKRGRTEARLVFERDGVQVDPLTASGGGVVDVASFGLRLSCLMLSRPPLRKLLVMDEPFRFVSKNFRPRVKAMMETLAKELGVQIIMITHHPELEAGEVYEI
jgi:hypothetical protein